MVCVSTNCAISADCHEAHQLYQYGQTVELGPSLSQDEFSSFDSQDNCEKQHLANFTFMVKIKSFKG